MTHQISAEHLTIQKIAEIIEGHHQIKLSADAIKRQMEKTPGLKVTLPNLVDDEILDNL